MCDAIIGRKPTISQRTYLNIKPYLIPRLCFFLLEIMAPKRRGKKGKRGRPRNDVTKTPEMKLCSGGVMHANIERQLKKQHNKVGKLYRRGDGAGKPRNTITVRRTFGRTKGNKCRSTSVKGRMYTLSKNIKNYNNGHTIDESGEDISDIPPEKSIETEVMDTDGGLENDPGILEVTCGENNAVLSLEKLSSGSKGSCVWYDERWITPNEFQYISGRGSAKDWKRSIKHSDKSLKILQAKGLLSFKQRRCRCCSCKRRSGNGGMSMDENTINSNSDDTGSSEPYKSADSDTESTQTADEVASSLLESDTGNIDDDDDDDDEDESQPSLTSFNYPLSESINDGETVGSDVSGISRVSPLNDFNMLPEIIDDELTPISNKPTEPPIEKNIDNNEIEQFAVSEDFVDNDCSDVDSKQSIATERPVSRPRSQNGSCDYTPHNSDARSPDDPHISEASFAQQTGDNSPWKCDIPVSVSCPIQNTTVEKEYSLSSVCENKIVVVKKRGRGRPPKKKRKIAQRLKSDVIMPKKVKQDSPLCYKDENEINQIGTGDVSGENKSDSSSQNIDQHPIIVQTSSNSDMASFGLESEPTEMRIVSSFESSENDIRDENKVANIKSDILNGKSLVHENTEGLDAGTNKCDSEDKTKIDDFKPYEMHECDQSQRRYNPVEIANAHSFIDADVQHCSPKHKSQSSEAESNSYIASNQDKECDESGNNAVNMEDGPISKQIHRNCTDVNPLPGENSLKNSNPDPTSHSNPEPTSHVNKSKKKVSRLLSIIDSLKSSKAIDDSGNILNKAPVEHAVPVKSSRKNTTPLQYIATSENPEADEEETTPPPAFHKHSLKEDGRPVSLSEKKPEKIPESTKKPTAEIPQPKQTKTESNPLANLKHFPGPLPPYPSMPPTMMNLQPALYLSMLQNGLPLEWQMAMMNRQLGPYELALLTSSLHSQSVNQSKGLAPDHLKTGSFQLPNASSSIPHTTKKDLASKNTAEYSPLSGPQSRLSPENRDTNVHPAFRRLQNSIMGCPEPFRMPPIPNPFTIDTQQQSHIKHSPPLPSEHLMQFANRHNVNRVTNISNSFISTFNHSRSGQSGETRSDAKSLPTSILDLSSKASVNSSNHSTKPKSSSDSKTGQTHRVLTGQPMDLSYRK